MDWKGCLYYQVSKMISDVEIEKMINVMIDNCDSNGKYYDLNKIEEFIKDFVHSKDFFSEIDKICLKECKKKDSPYSIEFSNIEFITNEVSSIILRDHNEEQKYIEEEKRRFVKNEIYKDILHSIEQVAINKRKERIYFRLNVGDNVNLDSCTLQKVIMGSIWFYKDGGWGVANQDGIVIVKNHLIHKPEWRNLLFEDKNPRYLKIQDRDTGLFGVLLLESYKEVIHCLYDEIQCVSYWDGNTNKYVVKVRQNDKWGCYDEDCAFIIDCKYDDICIIDKWIECCRDGSFLYSEIDYNKYKKSFYDGVKDLYTTEGILLLGGYNHFEFDYKRYFKFYFGTEHEEYYVKQRDIYDNEIELSRYKLNYDNSLCLVLDRHFRTITKYNGHHKHVPLGIVFQSLQDIIHYFPRDFLFSGKVDLSDFNTFIYLKKEKVEKFIISDYIEGSNADLYGECISDPGRWVDTFIEDDEVIIVKVTDDDSLSWRYRVNEIARLSPKTLLYRIGERVGFYSKDGFSDAIYSAVTTDRNENKTYVAQIFCERIERNGYLSNPNYIQHRQSAILYFELMESGKLLKMEDDWKVFDPRTHKWFPADFLEKNELVDYDSMGDYEESCELSYEKYGGYNDYDDDTIDYGFDGFPEATWNVD